MLLLRETALVVRMHDRWSPDRRAGKLAKRLVDGDLSPATDEMRSVAIACAVAGAEGRSR